MGKDGPIPGAVSSARASEPRKLKFYPSRASALKTSRASAHPEPPRARRPAAGRSRQLGALRSPRRNNQCARHVSPSPAIASGAATLAVTARAGAVGAPGGTPVMHLASRLREGKMLDAMKVRYFHRELDKFKMSSQCLEFSNTQIADPHNQDHPVSQKRVTTTTKNKLTGVISVMRNCLFFIYCPCA
jgi:hypothetical protein